MATIFTHGIAAFTLGKTALKKTGAGKILIAGIVCSVLPDADVIAFAFGIPYESMWGHRGITHSVFFALLTAVFVTLLFYKTKAKFSVSSLQIAVFIFLCTLSHPLLDMLTDGGLGVALFAPFNNRRYFFNSFRPLKVSPFGAGIFSKRGFMVILSELQWVIIPCLLLLLIKNLLKNDK